MNKIARIHVNQHVIKANAKNGENNPVFTIKQGGKNTYAHSVKVHGEMELVYSPDKPLSCGAKVWIETRGDIELDGKKIASNPCNEKPIKVIKDGNCTKKYFDGGGFSMTIDLEKSGMNEFLRKKRRQIKNKNKFLAI